MASAARLFQIGEGKSVWHELRTPRIRSSRWGGHIRVISPRGGSRSRSEFQAQYVGTGCANPRCICSLVASFQVASFRR
eukprot:2919937-Pyramimonas_sp.AAC.1